MGFNFGAFLGGAASQIVEDIDEQEKEVKLRTRTILDRQVAEAAENRKKFQEILQKEGMALNKATELVDTIVENKGVFTPNTNVDFFNNVGETDQKIITDSKKSLELQRALDEKIVKKFIFCSMLGDIR